MQLADKVGISQTYLSLVENDRKDPNLSVLKRIADSLSVPLPIIFFMSLDEEDVAEPKRAAFKLIQAPIDSMLAEFFIRKPS